MKKSKLHQALAYATSIPYRLRPRPACFRYHFIHIPKNGGSASRAANGPNGPNAPTAGRSPGGGDANGSG